MRGLTKTALNRPVSCLMIMIALVVFAISSISGFKMELTPDMEMPMLLVSAVYPGADAEIVEELVIKEIEDAGAALSGVKTITSSSAENYGMVMFQYDYGTDIDDAYTDLRNAIDAIKNNFPDDVNDPTIMELDMNASAVVNISATAVGSVDVLKYVEDELEPELKKIGDVADVTITGGTEEYVRVCLNKEKMQQYGLTMSTVAQYIAATNFSLPLGTITQGNQDFSVTGSAKVESLEELKQIAITTPKGALITLEDVADIYMANEDASGISRYNGYDSITIGVTKQQSADTVSVAKKITQLVEKINAQNEHIELRVIYDGSESILSSLTSVAETLVAGVILSMIVLFIFFGDIKASLIVGSSMPISLLATIICMSFAGFSLNLLTMGALVIAIGMMVDSSIVVLESCFRLKAEISDFKEATLKGTETVASSVIASTITTVVVYLPLSTMEGLSGQMFSQLGYTIIFAMLSSLIVSLTLIPLFFFNYRPKEKEDILVNRIVRSFGAGYKRVMRHVIYKKKTVLIVAILLLIGAFKLAGQLNMELMPSTGSDTISVGVTFRSGTKLEYIDESVRWIEEVLKADSNFDSLNLSISGNTASFSAYIADDAEMTYTQLVEKYTVEFSNVVNMDVSVSADSSSSMMGSSGTAEVDIAGDDLDTLKEFAEEIKDLMRGVNGVLRVSTDAGEYATKAKLKVDSLKAASYGLTTSQIAMEAYYALSGQSAVDVTWGDEEYSVKVEYPDGTYVDANDLMDISIATATGRTVKMSEIATIEYTDAPQSISRTDRTYQIAITANVTQARKFTAQNEIDAAVAQLEFPEGVSLAESTMDSMMGEEFSALFGAIATAVFLIFMVMAMQFESVKFSLMVMLSIPFSLIGSFFLLYITDSTLSMTSLMGILMLVGIVVNNGILFVDTTNQLRYEMPLGEALLEAGAIRLRPILMTTLTTILSMLIMAFDTSESGQMMRGMSLIIIGGLITSTVLILMLLPSFYLLLDTQARKEARQRRRRRRGRLSKNDDEYDEFDD